MACVSVLNVSLCPLKDAKALCIFAPVALAEFPTPCNIVFILLEPLLIPLVSTEVVKIILPSPPEIAI